MDNEKFSAKKRLRSFKYAFNGLKILIRDEHNARIHFVVFLLALILGILLSISAHEWIIIFLVSSMVFSMEIINSAIENLADLVSLDKSEKIKKIKDLSAAAVLISAIVALIAGCIIFIPKLLEHA